MLEKNKCFQLLLFLFLAVNFSGYAQKSQEGAGNTGNKIVPSMATWSMDSTTVSLAATYSPFNVLANLRSLGRDRDLMDDEVHREIKKRAEYAVKMGIGLVADLDPRV